MKCNFFAMMHSQSSLVLIVACLYSVETSKFRLNSDEAGTAATKDADAWKNLFGETLTFSDEYMKEVIPVSKLTSIVLKYSKGNTIVK